MTYTTTDGPVAAGTVGIRVLATRYRNVIIPGLIAGLVGKVRGPRAEGVPYVKS